MIEILQGSSIEVSTQRGEEVQVARADVARNAADAAATAVSACPWHTWISISAELRISRIGLQ